MMGFLAIPKVSKGKLGDLEWGKQHSTELQNSIKEFGLLYLSRRLLLMEGTWRKLNLRLKS